MANEKLTDRTALAAGSAVDDLYMVVDVSDTTGSAQGTSKQQTTQNVFNSLDNLAVLSANPAPSADSFLLNDNGTAKQITYQYMHGVYSTTIVLSEANITNLHSTPVNGIAGTADHIIQPIWASIIMTGGSGTQSGKASINLYYDSLGEDGAVFGTNHYNGLSGTKYTWVYGLSQTAQPDATIIAEDIKVTNFNDAFTSGVWTAASIVVLYRLVSMA